MFARCFPSSVTVSGRSHQSGPNVPRVPFRPPSDPERFPIDHVTDEVLDALAEVGTAIVVAPPGAGKTTRLPLAVLDTVLDTPFAAGGMVVLTQPRRLAARMAAERLAETVGSRVGEVIGLRTGEDTKVSARTKLTVTTEGVLVRMLQSDASLDGVSTVLLDEVHERSLDVDIAMALLRDVRATLRPELRLALLSATLDDTTMAAAFDAPVVRSEGRAYPVDRLWEPVLVAELAKGTAEIVAREVALLPAPGTTLVFVPGAAEMHAVIRELDRRRHPATSIVALHGGSPRADVAAALRPLEPGELRVVVATNVAQTSLTLPDVRLVIDQGLIRRSVTDASTGLSRLAVERVSAATATQRAGRSGRTAPGRAIALWSATEHRSLDEFDRPEIDRADLTDVVLASAVWGARSSDALSWVTAPPEPAWEAATANLRSLGAIAADSTVTPIGERMAAMPISAPLARIVLGASALGPEDQRRAIALVALLASDRRTSAIPLDEQVTVLAVGLGQPSGRGAGDNVERLARRLLPLIPAETVDMAVRSVGGLLSLAIPSRIATRLASNAARYRFVDGLEAELGEAGPVRGATAIVATELDADRRRGRIFSAVAVDVAEVEVLHAERLSTSTSTQLDGDALDGAISAVREVRLGAAVLSRSEFPPSRDDIASAVLARLDEDTLRRWMRSSALESLGPRVVFVASRDTADGAEATWPNLSAAGLLAAAHEWLVPLLAAASARRPLRSVSPADALALLLDRWQRQELDRRAPDRVTLPTGREVAVDYVGGAGPTIRAKLQEFLGTRSSPTVDGVPCVVELLTPAGRPAAITDDLARFWDVGYPHVRAELRGRYPKHDWPADPLDASPQRGVKRRT